ncbi:MAG: sulfite exporter TauE/SafE family protein [Chloroflexi bacterium]|nr:sulfite exporter TauE/SafE family protein [Chloroflexota bacterium]
MDYVLIAILAAGAAFVQANIGFGYALLFAPVAAFFIGPAAAIATSMVSGTLISLFLYVDYTPRAPLLSVTPMALTAIVSSPLGLWLLATSDEAVLRLLLGAAVLFSAAVTLRHPTRDGVPQADRLGWQIGTGVLSGVMRGSVSMGGPPVVLYQHWIGGGAAAIRARMFAFFAWTAIPAIVIAAATGIFTTQVWLYSAVAGISLPVGILAGRFARPRMDERLFGRLSMGLLGGAAAVATLGAAFTLFA